MTRGRGFKNRDFYGDILFEWPLYISLTSGWAPWGPWGKCTVEKCGQTGRSWHSRKCLANETVVVSPYVCMNRFKEDNKNPNNTKKQLHSSSYINCRGENPPGCNGK